MGTKIALYHDPLFKSKVMAQICHYNIPTGQYNTTYRGELSSSVRELHDFVNLNTAKLQLYFFFTKYFTRYFQNYFVFAL